MASAQAMEEELQQSVLLSEGVESDATESFADNASRLHARRARRGDGESVKSGPPLHQDYGMENHVNVIDGHMSDQDASGEEIDQDMAGEEDKDALVHQIVVGHVSAADDMDEEEDEPGQGKEGRGGVEDEDEDMEEQEEEQEEDGGLEEGGQGVQAGKGVQGEEGDEQVEQGQDDEEEEDDDGQDEDEDEDEDDDMDTQEQYAQGEDQDGDDEGVGAVKIKPGESESEQEDGESVVSDIEDESDEDGGAWEEGEGADEDDESDAAVGNTCIFCKQDEENDPSEDFEAFLTCKGCSENAHQQCARDAAAMSPQNTSNAWRCPECVTGESDVDADLEMQEVDSCANKEETQSTAQPSDAWARQKRESEEGAVDKGGMEGARILRKRKTSSAEPDDAGGSVRKRRRNQSSESTQEADGPGEAARSSRASRLKVSRRRLAQVEKRSRTSLVVRMEVRPGNLKEILSRKKRQRRPAASLQSTRLAAGGGLLPTPFTTDIYSQPFYSLFDKETDDAKGKPYGGILSEAEADTSKTMPAADDRKRFDEAKQKAEDEWRARVLAMQAEADVPVRKAKKANDKASQIECIEFGGWEIDTWYAAPYPAEYSRNRVLYICEFCLKYMNSDYVAWRHKLKCAAKHPPGDEIYRHGSVSIFEVDGRKHPVYCQNLCLLAKLFLGSKTLYYDVEPFLFYILCEYDERGYHFVGYFSKEKRASSQNNVSCILTLPIHQRKGYGNLLIDFSYLLTRVEHKTGSPEKPLSDMGLVSYRNYWRLELCRYFVNVVDSGAAKQGLSVKRISDDTGMTPDDVVSALEGLRALVRDPHTKLYAFRLDVDYFRHYVAKWESKGYVRLRPQALAWTPYVMGRSNAVNFELGPPISTVAPRDDDEAKLKADEAVDEAQAAAADDDDVLVNGQGANGHDVNGLDPDARDANAHDANAHDANAHDANPHDANAHDAEPVLSIETAPAADDSTNGLDPQQPPSQAALHLVGSEAPDSWMAPYKDLAPTRFEVFPPLTGRRADRVFRPPIPRTPAHPSRTPGPPASRPRARRSAGSSVRRASGASRSRPRSGTVRRKTGGTGRGPGRWPKGTKKSDYGNADSGPGLPPGWREKQARLRTESDSRLHHGHMGDKDEPAQDEVQVVVAKAAERDDD